MREPLGGTMTGMADRRIREALDALASAADPAAAGVAAALGGAAAASMVELSAGLAAKRLAEDPEHLDHQGSERMSALSSRANELRRRLLEAADEDIEAYARVGRSDDAASRVAALAAAADPPLTIAECAAELAEGGAAAAALSGDWAFAADAEAGVELAAASARGAARLVEVNLGAGSGDPRVAQAREAAARASGATASREG